MNENMYYNIVGLKIFSKYNIDKILMKIMPIYNTQYLYTCARGGCATTP